MTTYGLSVPTCNDESVFISNHHNLGNLTYIFRYDQGAGTYTNLLAEALPYNLLPAVPAVGDAIYFGIDETILYSGPFTSLVFDIQTAQVDLTDLIWQNWTGAVWTNMVGVQDNTNDDGVMTGEALNTTSIKSVHWDFPVIFAKTTVNGISGWWVRLYVNGIGGAPASPVQQNRHPYTINWPYIEISEDDINGDIEALLRLKIRNQSDNNRSGVPFLPGYRVIVGLRSLDRGEDFTSWINLYDANVSVPGMTFSSASFAASNATSAGGYMAITNPPAAWDSNILNFPAGISKQFYGVYRAFIYGNQTNGAITDLIFRLAVQFHGASPVYSKTVSFDTVGDDEILDLGIVTLPPTSLLGVELSDDLEIDIQVYGNGSTDAILYNLILIPVDEWALDTTSNNATNYISARRVPSDNTYLDIDSVIRPKNRIRSLLRIFIDDDVAMIWQSISNGSAILNNSKNQRLWFLVCSYDADCQPVKQENANSITAEVLQRYFSLRGDN